VTEQRALVRTGLRLEYATLTWNVVGVAVLVVAAVSARSVALAGFGFDSLIEIGASAVVVWELRSGDVARQRRALRLIGFSFVLLGVYLLTLTAVDLVEGAHPRHSPLGIGWTAATALAMFALAYAKGNVGKLLGNPVLTSEGRVTFIDGMLATSVLAGLCLNALAGWWWADPLAAMVIVFYATREAKTALASRA
jgi:divalent metal cation (Fe/Co/Zn/Cd) transporter